MSPQSIDHAQDCIPALSHCVSVSVVSLIKVCLPPPAYRLHYHVKKNKKTFYLDCHIWFHFKLCSCLLWLTRRRWLRDSNLLRHSAAAQPPQIHAETSRLAEQKSDIYGLCSRFASQQKWKWKWESCSLGLWWTGRLCETGYTGIRQTWEPQEAQRKVEK